MTDIFNLVTSAAWRKLDQLCSRHYFSGAAEVTKAQVYGVKIVSVAPYSNPDLTEHIQGLANEDSMAACCISMYRTNLIFALKHIINHDLTRANESAQSAIIYLHEGLNRIDLARQSDPSQILPKGQCLVNSLFSQAELLRARHQRKISAELIFVLGMHRSGTSALTGMLGEAGFSVPTDLMPATKANPKGYWESLGVFGLNENFLQQMESHWSSVLPLPAEWHHGISAREWRAGLLNTICQSFAGAALPIIKDPRFCRLIPGLEPWLESLLIETFFFIPIRHPLEVANSLSASEGTNLDQALKLWLTSVFISEQASRGHRRLFINFDSLIEHPSQVLEGCLSLLKSSCSQQIDLPIANPGDPSHGKIMNQASGFIDQSLKRQQRAVPDRGSEYKSSKTHRLIHFAETIYQSIIDNIADDDGISLSLDKHWHAIEAYMAKM